MAFSPPAACAGSQAFGHANTAGANAHLFQPPESPCSITSTSPTVVAAPNHHSFPVGHRKRQRPDPRDDTGADTSGAETPDWPECPTPRHGIYASLFDQGSVLVNERYRLAGGSDTPSLETAVRLEQLTVDEHEFRSRLRDDDMGNPVCRDCAPLAGPLARERNGVARVSVTADSVSQKTTWKSLAFGLVGKMLSLGGSVVRGFYAGNGGGYEFNPYSPVISGWPERNGMPLSSPLPGSWQQEKWLSDFEQDSPSFVQQTATPTPSAIRPPNKRRQTDRDAWVVVDTPDISTRPCSPRRKVSGDGIPRSKLAGKPPASRPSSKKKKIAPVSRRTAPYGAANGSPAQQPFPTHQALSPSRKTPTAFIRASQGLPMSPASVARMTPEAERYVKRQSKQDKAAEKSISSMGRRMEEMIRQAQEALNTKVSIEGDMDIEDEGYVDEE